MSSPALLILFFFSTVVSPTAINQLSTSARLCLRTRTVIMSLIGGMAVVFRFSSVLCQLSHPKDASSVSLVPCPSRGSNTGLHMFPAYVISIQTPLMGNEFTIVSPELNPFTC